MIQNGIVIKIKKNMAQTEIMRSTACGDNCASCGLCPAKSMTVLAENTIGAAEGDAVLISMSDKKVLGTAFMVYIIPVIMLITCYAAGSKVFNTEPGAICSGFGLMATAFLVIMLIDRKSKKRYVPKIIKIIKAQAAPKG